MVLSPWLASGSEGLITWGVGIRYEPSGSFILRSCRATGLILEPLAATETPPNAPLIPANIAPSACAERSLVSGGNTTSAEHAIRACPAANPLVCRVPWYDPK